MASAGSKDEHDHLRRWCWCLADEWPLRCGVVHHFFNAELPACFASATLCHDWWPTTVWLTRLQCRRCAAVQVALPALDLLRPPSGRFLLSPLAGCARRRPLWERCVSCGSASAINHLTTVECATPLSLLKLAVCRTMKNWEVWPLL